jgi:branched-chain amino acid aminotransferase
MQNAIINVNGQILSPDEAKVSVFDRGYLYGDSLYEVVRSYQGEFFLLEDHLKRLEKSAQLCQMTLDQNLKVYRDEIYRTFQIFKANPEYEKAEAYARLIISRGAGKIGFDRSCVLTRTLYTLILQPVEAANASQWRKGMKLKVVDRLRNDRRALDPAMKSGNYLNSVLAYLEAAADQYNDALLCNSEGHLTEGTTFNIFYCKRGILVTPPLDIGILEGITRKKILELAKEMNIPIREVRFPKERLYEADEVFVTSSIREVLPVTQVDEKIIKNGSPGPLTQKFFEAYQKLTKRRAL